MIRMLSIAVVLGALPACGDDGGKTADAAIDAAAPSVTYTGEMIDWDSDHGALFCGVFNAVLVEHDNPANTIKSAPNGRMVMMVPDNASVRIDVTPPTDVSQCAPNIGLYQLPGIIITGNGQLDSGKDVSFRMIGMNRIPTWFSQFGLTYDPAKAIVFVHVEGTQVPVKSSAASDTPIANTEATWAAGTTGQNVVFPNSAVGTSMISLDGVTALNAQTVPTVAGTITYITLVDPS